MSSPSNIVCSILDRWLSFESTALEVAQIYCLRERLSAAILFKASHPRLELPPDLATSVQAIACLLSNDGLSGITVSVKSDTPAAWMVNATTGMGRSAGGEQKKDLTKARISQESSGV
ncbi:DExH-box ATP-dependent RNA helicase DExH6-like protein [Drosera capensis]